MVQKINADFNRGIEWRRLSSKSSFKMNSFGKEKVPACNFRFHIWHQSKFIKVPFQFSTNLQKIAKRTVTNKHLENHIACFFPVGPQHSRWWKGDRQITTHHITHQITSRKRIAASVQQFWEGSVLGYQRDNLAFFENRLEYHQPFFTVFAVTLRWIEKRPNVAVL